jgi:hypothetical protein
LRLTCAAILSTTPANFSSASSLLPVVVSSENPPIRNEKPLSHIDGRGVGVRVNFSKLRTDQFADLLFDLVHLGEAVRSTLGKDLPPVEKDFERSRFAGGYRHRPQVIVVVVQQVLRQTGGSSEIPSGGAVLDPYGWLLPGRGLALGALVGHVVTSVRLRSSRVLPQGPLQWRVSHGLAARTTSRAPCMLHAACPATGVD